MAKERQKAKRSIGHSQIEKEKDECYQGVLLVLLKSIIPGRGFSYYNVHGVQIGVKGIQREHVNKAAFMSLCSHCISHSL